MIKIVMHYFMKSKNNGTPVPRKDNFNGFTFIDIVVFSVHFKQHGQRASYKLAISSYEMFLPTALAFSYSIDCILNADVLYQSLEVCNQDQKLFDHLLFTFLP